MKTLLVFISLICLTAGAFPQDSAVVNDTAGITSQIYNNDKDTLRLAPPAPAENSFEPQHINWTRTAILGGSVVAVNAGLWLYYENAWYSGTRTGMHSYDDWYNGNLNIDKFGHFHWAITENKLLYRALKWANFNDDQSMWYGAAIGWLLHLQIELEDSRYAEWGFSWGDLGANTFGQLYPNLQRIYTPLQALNVKVSYYPSPNYRNGVTDYAINDYEGRTYWITLNLHSVMPGSVDKVIPDWLNLAVGYGGNKLVWPNGHLRQINNEGIGEQEWYIALDYDLLKIFKPKKDTFWYILLEQLDGIHFPAPAIRIKPSAIYYGIYF